MPVSSASTDRGMDALFGTDAAVLDDPMLRHHLFVTMTEGLRQAFSGVLGQCLLGRPVGH